MIRKCWRAARAHPWRGALVLVVLAFLFLNALAFFHARSATHLSRRAGEPIRIDDLTLVDKLVILLTGVPALRPAISKTPADRGLESETVRFETADGLQLEAWRIPRPDARAVVILFHGYTESRSTLLPEAARLHALRCEPWLVDFRGSGGSEGDITSIGYHEALDVEAAFDHVRQATGAEPVLFARSMGAAAVLRAVHERLVVPRAVILESPFDRMLSTIENRFAILGVPSFPSAQLMTFWGGMQLGFDALSHDPVDYARSLEVPTLFHYGALDRRVLPEQSRAVIAAAGRNATVHVFDELEHESFLRGSRDEWTQSVEEFLAALP